ncbi:MerR family transcriptional regulator [Streptomyces albofaciens JCM 4342]|uniref:MerR family transcriptional regulator n=1 Tax=Streptomyces albofaciens TaxID=66866 RepID=UPI0012385F65|nr:MerR family transcriptional regulator [Streptomyces albofaciens]KAA6214533.1 MerR family transcriptional regulator [Streptomyces albofaciens JCM 4342]
MRIGELAERTGTSRRLLRYYEEQQLITPGRSSNGYREYEESHVGRVLQIKGLLGAGLPTRIIRQLLPCLDKPRSIYFDDLTPEMLSVLEREHDQLTQRIDCLTRNRDAIGGYLETVRGMRAAADAAGRADAAGLSGRTDDGP